MPQMPAELPDVDPQMLNEMIRDIAREMGCPPAGTVYPPDLVELGEIPQHIYGYNAGCTPSGVEQYRVGQKWRRKALDELNRRPEWVQEWLADAETDRRIEQLCEAKGLRFAPHECPPWMVRCNEELPEPQDGVWYESARLAQRLRRQLEAEIRATRER